MQFILNRLCPCSRGFMVATSEIAKAQKWSMPTLKEYLAETLVVQEESNTLYINSLAVAPEFRRLGIATYILNYVERLAKRIE